MKTKFGAIVVDGRGKIGGHVASKNRAGSYFRTKVTPVNRQNANQLAVRNRFANISQGWRGITQSARDSWNAAVGDFARTDIFGDLRNPTGFNLYQRLNNNLSIISGVKLVTPPLPSPVGVVVAKSLTVTVGTPALSLVMDEAVPAGTAVKVFATAPQSAGKSFVKSEFRMIAVLAPAAAATANILSDYQDRFGGIGEIGQKIFVRLEAVNFLTGQAGTPSEVAGVATA